MWKLLFFYVNLWSINFLCEFIDKGMTITRAKFQMDFFVKNSQSNSVAKKKKQTQTFLQKIQNQTFLQKLKPKLLCKKFKINFLQILNINEIKFYLQKKFE